MGRRDGEERWGVEMEGEIEGDMGGYIEGDGERSGEIG